MHELSVADESNGRPRRQATMATSAADTARASGSSDGLALHSRDGDVSLPGLEARLTE